MPRITDKILREEIESLAQETGIDFRWGHSNGFARIERDGGRVLVYDGTNKECLEWIKAFRYGWHEGLIILAKRSKRGNT